MPKNIDEYFALWRSSDAPQEQAFIKTAALIQKYLRYDDLEQIKKDAHNKKERTKEYGNLDKYGKRSLGCLVHTVLAIDEALDTTSFDDPTNRLLRNTREALASLYISPYDQPLTKFSVIKTNTEFFLDTEIRSLSDKKKAKYLYICFYLAFNIMKRSLGNLNLVQKGIASGLGIKISELMPLLEPVIEKIEAKYTLITAQIANPIIESEAIVAAASTLSIVTHSPAEAASGTTQEMVLSQYNLIQQRFNQVYTAELSEVANEQDTLNTLVSNMQKIAGHVADIIDDRQQITAISSNIMHVQKLLDAFNNNDRLIKGRAYFLELRHKFNDAFNILMQHSAHSTVKNDLIVNITKQQQERIKARGLHAVSTALSPFTVITRTLVPQIVQDTVSSYVLPQTLDSEAKKLLKTLAAECLATLKQQLDEKKRQNEQALQALSAGDEPLRALLLDASLDNLHELAIANTVKQPLAPLKSSITTEAAIAEPSDDGKTIQSLFNVRYNKILNDKHNEVNRINELTTTISHVTININLLIATKVQQNNKALKIKQRTELLAALAGSNANAILMELENQNLTSLKQSYASTTQKINDLANTLAQGEEQLRKRLINSSADTLKAVTAAHIAITECMDHYTVLSKKINNLKVLNKYSDNLSNYIAINDGILMWLSNFVAKWLPCLFSQSDTGKMIEEAQTLKGELVLCEEEYDNEIKKQKKFIRGHSTLDQSIKDSLVPNEPTDIPRQSKPSVTKKTNAKTTIKNCTEFFGKIKKNAPIDELDLESEGVLSLPTR